MNTSLQNQTLAGDALRAGTSAGRAGASKLPLQLGADDAALPFKRMLSELKQGGPSTALAARLAAPQNTTLTAPPAAGPAPAPAAAAAPGSATRSERQAQPSAESRSEGARHESNRLQARRSQAQASEQALERTRAQLARTNSARPGDGVVAAPIQHQPQPAAPVQGQPEDGSESACPAEESQLNAGADAAAAAGATATGQDPATQSRLQRCLGLMPSQDAELDDKTRSAAGAVVLQQDQGAAALQGSEAGDGAGRKRDASDGAGAASEAGLAAGSGPNLHGRDSTAAQLPVAAELVGEGRGARARDVGRSDRGGAGEPRRSGPLAASDGLSQTDKISGMAGGIASSALAADEKSGSASFAGELQAALGRSSTAGAAGSVSARGAEGWIAGALDGTRAPTPAGTDGAAEPSVLTMSQALHDPSFAPELGARLSLLAADGVQQAQLHLNPAEMGPVAIQIQLDGQQAQISFQAENAETRKVLEQGLPDLAAALREAGLTLSGGGVFQQSSEGRKGQQDQAEGRSVNLSGLRGLAGGDALSGAGAAGGPVAARPPQGMLDLYA